MGDDPNLYDGDLVAEYVDSDGTPVVITLPKIQMASC